MKPFSACRYLLGILLVTLAPEPVPAVEPQRVELYVGQAHVLEEGQIKRIVVGNGKVIQATALDDRQVLVIPEAPGQSTLHVWGRAGVQKLYVINVVPADAGRLQAEIQSMLGEGANNLRSRVVGDKVIVEGGNLSEEQAGRVSEVAKRYPQIVNLVSRVGLERMVAMDVRMVEIKRDVLKNIGVKWNGSAQGPTFGILGDAQRSNAFNPGGAADGVAGLDVRRRVPLFSTVLGLATSIGSMLNFLVQNGDAIVLAEPRLSCRSGGSARFVAGGELPIPFSAGLGAVSVMFKEYGVKFDVQPVVSESGVISAKIATEISAINFDVTVRDIPGLTKRRAETEVNLREHETLVIAGLLSEESSRSLDKVAGLGELPVLGALFRSRQFRERVTDLVVFVTPHLVSGDPDPRPDVLQQSGQRLDAARERVQMLE
jgi:pilus assembly protein CpaC